MHWADFFFKVMPKFDLARQRQHVYACVSPRPEVLHARHLILHIPSPHLCIRLLVCNFFRGCTGSGQSLVILPCDVCLRPAAPVPPMHPAIEGPPTNAVTSSRHTRQGQPLQCHRGRVATHADIQLTVPQRRLLCWWALPRLTVITALAVEEVGVVR